MSLVDQMVLAIGECELLLDFATEELEDIARIAIAAIRVPTDAMMVAGHNVQNAYATDEIYTAMIDAALTE